MRPRIGVWVTLSVVVGLLAPTTPTASAAATIHVPADHPTIQAAIDAAQDGDVIEIAPGTYQENVVLGKSVTLMAAVYDEGDPRNNTTALDGSGGTVVAVPSGVAPGPSLVGLVITNGVDGVRARSPLTVESSYFTGNGDDIDYEAGSGGVCRGNVFVASGDDAIDLDHQVVDLTIEGNRILQTSRSDDGIEIRLHDDDIAERVDILIRGNEITGSGEDGIQIIDYYQDTNRRITIERNLIRDVAMAAIGLMDDANTSEDYRAASITERIHVFNNTIVGNDHGISGGDNLIAVNNLFVGSTTIGVKGVDGGSIVSHSLFWGNGADAVASNVDPATTLLADPLLAPDHTLSEGSPAIDAGTPFFEWMAEPVLDLPPGSYSGAAPDLGAREHASTGPTALEDAVVVDEGSSGNAIDVLANDTDSDGDALTIASVSDPPNGTAAVDDAGTPADPMDDVVRYSPEPNFTGTDAFTYEVSDGNGGTATATVTVTVSNLNDPPDAVDDAATVQEDSAGNPVDVLANDSDIDGDPLRITGVSDPPNGTAAVDDAGTPADPMDDVVRYSPEPNFTGTDPFAYEVADGNGGTDTAVVSITITDVNDPPDALDDSATTRTDTAVEIPVLANDVDVDGDALTVVAVSTPPASGTASIGSGGSVTYTPSLGFVGADAFAYTVDDGRGGTDTAVVTIAIDGGNLVGNSGFETDTTGWTTSEADVSLTRVAGGHTGDWSAEVANTSSTSLKCRMADRPNWVTATSEGTYTVGIWVRGEDAGGTVKLRIREFAGGILVGAVYVYEPLTTTWVQISLPYTVLSPGSTLDVSASRNDAPPGTCFYADDVSIAHA